MIPPNGQWKVHIVERAWDRMYIDLFIYRNVDKDNIRILYIDDPIQWTFREEPVSMFVAEDKTKPSLRLPRDVLSGLMPALLEKGIKPPDEGKLAGLYEAQSKHLVDLQNILTLVMGTLPTENKKEEHIESP